MESSEGRRPSSSTVTTLERELRVSTAYHCQPPVSGQPGLEQVRDQAVALALGTEVLADLLGGGDALHRGAGDVDGGGQEGVRLAGAPDGHAGARADSLLGAGCLAPAGAAVPASGAGN